MTSQNPVSGLDVQRIIALLHVSSPALPIGGFSYSQGLEAAVELRLVHDEASALAWIDHQLTIVMARSEAPLWCLLFDAWQTDDDQAVIKWNQWFYASRETLELRQETAQMGKSLYKLGQQLNWCNTDTGRLLETLDPITLPCMHACVCSSGKLPRAAALGAYLFTWLENQVTSAIKSVPIGQLAGQRILAGIAHRIPEAIDTATARSDPASPMLDTFAPQYAIISARHESQFSRLFRS